VETSDSEQGSEVELFTRHAVVLILLKLRFSPRNFFDFVAGGTVTFSTLWWLNLD
jgi:hypothetical protein